MNPGREALKHLCLASSLSLALSLCLTLALSPTLFPCEDWFVAAPQPFKFLLNCDDGPWSCKIDRIACVASLPLSVSQLWRLWLCSLTLPLVLFLLLLAVFLFICLCVLVSPSYWSCRGISGGERETPALFLSVEETSGAPFSMSMYGCPVRKHTNRKRSREWETNQEEKEKEGRDWI